MNRIHLLRKLCLLVAWALFVTGCQKDNIINVDRIATLDDVNDDIVGTTFAQIVYVTFSDQGNAVVTGATDDLVNGGTSYYEDLLYQDTSVSGGSSVSLSSYTGGNEGGGGPF